MGLAIVAAVCVVLFGVGFLALSDEDGQLTDWWHTRKLAQRSPVQPDPGAACKAVDNLARRLRQEMNEAVGQSWRNLVD